jgi:ArsR family transcriptional regulator
MASSIQCQPTSPKQASRRRGRIDQRLDPSFFKAIGEPTRAGLLACLIKCGRPCSVTEVSACCSIDFSMVARHLSALARAGVLKARKEGRTVWYEASCADLSARFRSLADAIEEWDRDPDTECGCDDR